MLSLFVPVVSWLPFLPVVFLLLLLQITVAPEKSKLQTLNNGMDKQPHLVGFHMEQVALPAEGVFTLHEMQPLFRKLQ